MAGHGKRSLFEKCLHYSRRDPETPCHFLVPAPSKCVGCSNFTCFDEELAKRYKIKRIPFDGIDLKIAMRKMRSKRKA